ncbi:MAG: hypothetical protein O2973_06505, partial [Gemmatimonadetes bacterium]|nr:hypothetical protein [Gemmatimonadota bacterium]
AAADPAAGRGGGRGGRGGGAGGRGAGGRGAGGRGAGGRGAAEPNPNGPSGADTVFHLERRFTNNRGALGLDFIQAQRHRLRVIHEMAAVMKDFDLYVSGQGDVGLLNQTGHPAAVFPYAFGKRAGRGGAPAAADTKDQPLCVTLVGQLFADDTILSVAHAFQKATDFHLRKPTIT